MSTILAAIEALRTQAITGQTVKSRDAVRSNMHQARNNLSRAIVERAKGVNDAFVKRITSCQELLEKALQFW